MARENGGSDRGVGDLALMSKSINLQNSIKQNHLAPVSQNGVLFKVLHFEDDNFNTLLDLIIDKPMGVWIIYDLIMVFSQRTRPTC